MTLKIITKALMPIFYPCATEGSQLFSLLCPLFEHRSRVLRDSEHKGGADSMLQLHYKSVWSPVLLSDHLSSLKGQKGPHECPMANHSMTQKLAFLMYTLSYHCHILDSTGISFLSHCFLDQHIRVDM